MPERIIRKILCNLDWIIHETDKSILFHSDKVRKISFIQSGQVQLFDKFLNPIL